MNKSMIIFSLTVLFSLNLILPQSNLFNESNDSIICYDTEELQIYCEYQNEQIIIDILNQAELDLRDTKNESEDFFNFLDILFYGIPIVLFIIMIAYLVLKRRKNRS